MDDLVKNYYSYYDELETDNPDIGLIFYHNRPDYESEIGWFTTLYRDCLNGNALAMVAEVDGRVVGICDVHAERPHSDVSHKGVTGMAIAKDHRGKGIGRELLSAVIEESKGLFDILILGVFSINERAISLYRKLGFVEYGRLPVSVKRNGKYYPETLMYLKL